eukprot:11244002-Ditylum_brightwellii.AAC.1
MQLQLQPTADISLLSTILSRDNRSLPHTGFGQAIRQIVELVGYDGDFKSAIFIQAPLFSMQPL